MLSPLLAAAVRGTITASPRVPGTRRALRTRRCTSPKRTWSRSGSSSTTSWKEYPFIALVTAPADTAHHTHPIGARQNARPVRHPARSHLRPRIHSTRCSMARTTRPRSFAGPRATFRQAGTPRRCPSFRPGILPSSTSRAGPRAITDNGKAYRICSRRSSGTTNGGSGRPANDFAAQPRDVRGPHDAGHQAFRDGNRGHRGEVQARTGNAPPETARASSRT